MMSTNKIPFPYSSLGCSNFGEQKPKPNFELQIKLSLTMKSNVLQRETIHSRNCCFDTMLKWNGEPMPTQGRPREGQYRECLIFRGFGWMSFWIHRMTGCALAAGNIQWGDISRCQPSSPSRFLQRSLEPQPEEGSKNPASPANLQWCQIGSWEKSIQTFPLFLKKEYCICVFTGTGTCEMLSCEFLWHRCAIELCETC